MYSVLPLKIGTVSSIDGSLLRPFDALGCWGFAPNESLAVGRCIVNTVELKRQ